MKNKVLAFTCLKLHFEGETFEPMLVGNHYQLQSVASVLVGSAGNPFEFKTIENANIWLDTNLIKASKIQTTKQEYIDKLIIKNSVTPQDYLQTEIDVLESRNAGEWSIVFNNEIAEIDGGNALSTYDLELNPSIN